MEDELLDPVRRTPVERLQELDGQISWEVRQIIDHAINELYTRRPSDGAEAEVMLWESRFWQLVRIGYRLERALESREQYGPRTRRRDTRRSGPKEPSRPGPQTLGEYVLQKCGTHSEEWKNYIRLKQLFGGGADNDTPSD